MHTTQGKKEVTLQIPIFFDGSLSLLSYLKAAAFVALLFQGTFTLDLGETTMHGRKHLANWWT